jgi:hypothetical protein
MDTNQVPSDEPRTAGTDKQPYEKPSFRYEKVFVTTALSCGKVGPNQLGCGQSQSSS